MTRIIGLSDDDGCVEDFLSFSATSDLGEYCKYRWANIQRSDPTIITDKSAVVLEIINSCDPRWWLFLLQNIISRISVMTGSYIVISTIHGTKGLTFHGTVVIVDYHTFTDQVEDRCLLYVALTRTTSENLFLFTCRLCDVFSNVIPTSAIMSLK